MSATLATVRSRCAARVAALTVGSVTFRESSRAFGLGEIPAGIAHGSFYVTIPTGIALGTWKVNDANGFDWQSNVEVVVAYRLAPHRSVTDEDVALVWGHTVLNQLVRDSSAWGVDLRIKGDGATVTVEPDTGGNFLLVRVGVVVRHNLSITSTEAS